jgi:hypothetical protein
VQRLGRRRRRAGRQPAEGYVAPGLRGQLDSAIFANQVTVDGNGAPTGGYWQSLIPFGQPDIRIDYDRVVRPPLVQALYGDADDARAVNGGLQQEDLPFLVDFDVVTWPAMRLESSTTCGYVNGNGEWGLPTK